MTMTIGNTRFDAVSGLIANGQDSKMLSGQKAAVLNLLTTNLGKMVPHEKFAAITPAHLSRRGKQKALSTLVTHIRIALQDIGSNVTIKSVYGRGLLIPSNPGRFAIPPGQRGMLDRALDIVARVDADLAVWLRGFVS